MEVFVQEDRALCIRKSLYTYGYSCSEHRNMVSLVAKICFQRRKNKNGTYDLVAILDEDEGDGWVIREDIARKDWSKYREWIRNFSEEDYLKLIVEIESFHFYDDDDADFYVGFNAKTF